MTNNQNGFSLIEVVVGSALFLVVAMAGYGAFTSLFQVAQANQTKLLAISLADEQLEIIRGMSYASVGLSDGIPHGTLLATQDITRGNIVFTVTLDIRSANFVSPLAVGGKLVEVSVSCASCKNFTSVALTGQFMPASI